MRKVLTLMGLMAVATLQLPAQNRAATADLSVEMASIEWTMDSLLAHFNFPTVDPSVFDTVALNKYNFPPDAVPTFSPDIYAARLKEMGSAIPFEYNADVQAFIDLYVHRRRDQVRRMLGLQYVFFPMIEEELDRNGMPLELKHLPIVESAFNPHAVSRAGATGLWQFMLPTGKLYNLNVTSFVDERRDPVKATKAAVRYLKNMYAIYKDWLLVIAAYNCGPGNVNRAIARSGGKMTFWEIEQYLPRETRGYVPAFIAANYVFKYSAEHNLFPRRIDFTYAQDTVHITRQQITLQQLAEVTGADFYMLCDLNPELKTSTIPYDINGYCLRVPHNVAIQFVQQRDTLYKQMAAITFDSIRNKYITSNESPITRDPYPSSPGSGSGSTATQVATSQQGTVTGNGILVYHTVRYGDIVSNIASQYWVTSQQISAWNGLSNYRIWPGQKLKVYVSEKRAAQLGIRTQQSPTAPQQANSTPQVAPQNEQPGNQSAEQQATAKTKEYYKVQAGDTLWDICQKYEGLTIDKLKTMNNLNGNSLMVGQVLVVKCGEC